jgi:hypothetical protein
MTVLLFPAISVLQIICYMIADKRKIKNGRLPILFIFLISYFFIPTFINQQGSSTTVEQSGCAMPIIGIYIAIWMLGTGLSLATHVIYYFVKNLPIFSDKKR